MNQKKRKNSGHTGLSPSDKELKTIHGSEMASRKMATVEEAAGSGGGVFLEGGDLTDNQDQQPRIRRNSEQSMMSAVSRISVTRRELDRSLAFVRETSDQQFSGPIKDRLTVDILQMGDDDFKGTIKIKEAKILIYKNALDLEVDNLHGVEIEWRGHPVITFRLKTPIDVDQHFRSDIFRYDRKTRDGEVLAIKGKVRGLRLGQETFVRGDEKRIKIKNCKWSMKESELLEWLNYYGTVVSPITEEVHDESDREEVVFDEEEDEDEDEGIEPIGTGNLWVTMRMTQVIPQFLPMHGKR